MAYALKATITIDNTKVSGSADITNIPILIKGTYDGTGGEPDIRTVANGGGVENVDTSGGAGNAISVPADLAFFSDSELTTQLDHEIQKYVASTGEIIAWVKIPTLDGDADTVIYMAYGDSAVTNSQEDLSGLWSDYLAVLHLNTSATANQLDSSGNSHTGTPAHAGNAWASEDSVAGKIDKALDFVAGDKRYIDIADALHSVTPDSYSVTVWFSYDASGGVGFCSRG